MGKYEYEVSKRIAAEEYPFYGLIMAAMRKADNLNAERLRVAFPDVHEELWQRAWNPGGLTDGEYERLRADGLRIVGGGA